MNSQQTIEPDLEFIARLEKAGGESLKKCYQCATCSVACELSPEDRPFPRKEMIWASWGLKDRLIADPDVWLCHQCNDCSKRCPRGARPGDVLAAVRSYVYEHNAFPKFMGRLLARPSGLPVLFLIPIIVLLVLHVVGHEEGFSFISGPVVYGNFLMHGWLEGLFITGNVLIFLIAGLGLYRFYRTLSSLSDRPPAGFVPSLLATVGEVLTHRRFNRCGQNAPRYTAHLLVFFGFFGAALTAGLALVYLIWYKAGHGGEIPHGIPITNPIKWLGALSGIAVVVGSVIMISRRAGNADDVGANGYADKLFLWMVFLVAATGMLTWIFRLIGIPPLAYGVYFVHLVVVFFLLWYMPYSKFAHMLYRGLAMVYARQAGRTLRATAEAALPAAGQPAAA